MHKKQNMNDQLGVRIIPPILEFKNVEGGNRYKIYMTVKNVSKTSREIRYWAPQRKVTYLNVAILPLFLHTNIAFYLILL